MAFRRSSNVRVAPAHVCQLQGVAVQPSAQKRSPRPCAEPPSAKGRLGSRCRCTGQPNEEQDDFNPRCNKGHICPDVIALHNALPAALLNQTHQPPPGAVGDRSGLAKCRAGCPDFGAGSPKTARWAGVNSNGFGRNRTKSKSLHPPCILLDDGRTKGGTTFYPRPSHRHRGHPVPGRAAG